MFADFPAFQAHLQRSLPLWAAQVQAALRLIALNGIVDPISASLVPATALGLSGGNYRETLSHNSCLSRHRAVLLVLQELLNAGLIPPRRAAGALLLRGDHPVCSPAAAPVPPHDGQ